MKSDVDIREKCDRQSLKDFTEVKLMIQHSKERVLEPGTNRGFPTDAAMEIAFHTKKGNLR
jgi:hypothetical protein